MLRRQWVSDVHHHQQTDDLRRVVEISERVGHGLKLPRRDTLRAFCLTTARRAQESMTTMKRCAKKRIDPEARGVVCAVTRARVIGATDQRTTSGPADPILRERRPKT
jgi:hypothetical protein